MTWKLGENLRRADAGKLMAGTLLGVIVGALVGWLTAPASGFALRPRFWGHSPGLRAKHRTAAGNVEGRVRELVEHRSGQPGPASPISAKIVF